MHNDPLNLLNPTLDRSFKAYPHLSPPLPRAEIGAQGWNVLAGDLPLPVAVVRQDALQHNLGWMQRFVADRGVRLAPHGKTSLSPQLFQQQLAAGAWGMTVAHVTQLNVAIAAGAQRCLIANQVFSAQDLRGIDALRQQHPGLQVVFLVDSVAQVDLIEAEAAGIAAAGAASPYTAPYTVLLEMGLTGGVGRTGCRSVDTAMAVAHRIRDSQVLALVGVECYEGLGVQGDSAADKAQTEALMAAVVEVARHCEAEGCWEGPEVILSAGGSSVFDLVMPALRTDVVRSRPVMPLLRSGCYVTHDHGAYRRWVSVLNQRLGCDVAQGLRGALEVWAYVQSLPEPGLAILSVGKRDVSYDMGLPTPVQWCPRGERVPQAAPGHWSISALNDQHAYLRWEVAADESAQPRVSLAVGDRVALGISHPCTTFDKWRWLPLVDAQYRVMDALTTCF